MDAAVATAFALGVVDPTCAGLGGQTVAILHLAGGRLLAIDGSAPVPIAAVAEEIRALRQQDRHFGYKVVATPSTLAALTHLLQRYGTMQLADVLQPAIAIAERGHIFRPYVTADFEDEILKIQESEFLSALFLREGREVWPPGCMIFQPALAATMRRLATVGAADFYRGAIASEIEADMLANGGYVRMADLAALRVVELQPLRGRYRGFEVISFPPPGGGGILLAALAILEQFPPEIMQTDSADRLHVLAEAVRIAMIDSSLASFPVHLDPTYGSRRAGLICLDRALREDEIAPTTVRWIPEHGTTHLSVVDRDGNAVALTQTLGSCAYVATASLGFAYNTMLKSFDHDNPGSLKALRPMRTAHVSTAPTILRRGGKAWLVLGSAGSARIPSSILAVISNLVDRGVGLGEAIALPRMVVDPPKDSRVLFELAGAITAEHADTLQERGFANQFRLSFPPRLVDLCSFGGVNAVMVEAGGTLVGVGDPRRQGGAAGALIPAKGEPQDNDTRPRSSR